MRIAEETYRLLELTFGHDFFITVPLEKHLYSGTTLKIYEVEDITYVLSGDFGGMVSIELRGQDGPTLSPDELVGKIAANISPETWERNGHNIQAHQGLLIVRAMPRMHAMIKRYLAWLRAEETLPSPRKLNFPLWN